MPIALVTGGAGFIGSHLVDALLAQGQSVRVLDDFSSGTRANLPADQPRLEIIHGSLTDPETVRGAVDGVTHVFHLAVAASAADSTRTSLERGAVAVETRNVLAAASDAGVNRVIYSSCECVYGASKQTPLLETEPTLPLSPYAFVKSAGEQLCVAYSAILGLETVRLRYFSVFGPRQNSSGIKPSPIHQILSAMLRGQSPQVFGDGEDLHDFVYVDDVVHANMLAAVAPRVSGKVYNIARGRPTTFRAVIACANALLGTNLLPRYDSQFGPDHDVRLTTITQAETDLGFCPSTDLQQGLSRCIDYYRAHPDELSTLPYTDEPQGPHFMRHDDSAIAHSRLHSASALIANADRARNQSE